MSLVPIPSPFTLRRHIQHKIVVVTGAASGIGFAISHLAAQHGAKVILVDLYEDKLRAAAASIGHDATYYACDVASWSNQIRLFDWVVRNHGNPDIVCLNAGVNPEIATVSKLSSTGTKAEVRSNYLADDYIEPTLSNTTTHQNQRQEDNMLRQPPDLLWDVNLKGVVYGMKLAIHHMSSTAIAYRKGGRIIITGSAGSYVPIAGQDIYAATKHAVLGLMRSTSQRPELKEKNISVAMVAPWLTMTPMTAEIRPELTVNTEASTSEDVAQGFAYFATEEIEFVNGRCLWTVGKRLIEVEGSYGKWLSELMKA